MAILVKVYVKKNDVKKDGTTGIYILVRIDNKDKLYHTGKFVLPQHFDNDKGIVKNADPNHGKLNHFLNALKQQYLSSVLDIENANQIVSHENIQTRVSLGPNVGFVEFSKKELARIRGTIGEKHHDTLKWQISKLEKYGGNVAIAAIDKVWLTNYQKYLIEKGNKTNTISGDMRMIRRFINAAIDHGLSKSQPFKTFSIKNEVGLRDFCTLEEVLALEDIYFSNVLDEAHQRTLNFYLSSCYIGVRKGDASKINTGMIDGNMFVLMTNKTAKPIYIPVTNRAKVIIEDREKNKMRDLPKKSTRITKQLAHIMSLAKINKHITFHSSRHTFAVVSITLGVDINVVKDILGHTTVKTTEIYAKIVNELKTKQMGKWDNF